MVVSIDRELDPRSGHAKHNTVGVCCVFSKHTTLRRKLKYRLPRNPWSLELGETCLFVDCCFSQLGISDRSLFLAILCFIWLILVDLLTITDYIVFSLCCSIMKTLNSGLRKRRVFNMTIQRTTIYNISNCSGFKPPARLGVRSIAKGHPFLFLSSLMYCQE